MRLIAIAALIFALSAAAEETNFSQMLDLAKRGDSMARVVVGYAFLIGEYRDGSPVEKDLEAAYSWASLAHYQGNPDAQALLNLVIPQLSSRTSADRMAGEYFKRFGAKRDSFQKRAPKQKPGTPHNKRMQTDEP